MKTVAVDIRPYFKPIEGQRPWRVRLGYGSFLTFDFGQRFRSNGHLRGEWHLWIYQSNWLLMHHERQLADSDSDRHLIDLAVRRLEGARLTNVKFDPSTSVSEFQFDEFSLVVSPADYLADPDERDEYWLLFMPQDVVLTVGPGGVNVGPSDQSPAGGTREEHKPKSLLVQPGKRVVHIRKKED
jgi:hypothetical protein